MTNSREPLPHGGRLLAIRPDHEPGGVAKGQDRYAEGVAKLHEPGALLRTLGVDGAAEVAGVVGDDAEGTALDAQESGDHAGAVASAQFQEAGLIRQATNDRPDVIGAHPVLGDGVAQDTLVGAGPVLYPALEHAQQVTRRRGRLRLVLDQQI